MALNSDFSKLLRESARLHREMAETMDGLRAMAVLADFIGVYFKELKGKKVSHGVIKPEGTHYGKPWKDCELVVRIDGLEVKRAPLIDTPYELWPKQMRKSYAKARSIEKRKRITQWTKKLSNGSAA